jgi:DNA (cytosine-5)-methyltransferase 1
VSEVFRLVDNSAHEWLLLENVPFMLRLDRGEAMRYLTHELDRRGYTWAYRVVDSRSFGLPQRRKRVVLLASRKHDPRPVLFADDAGEPVTPDPDDVACGFYWTEGIRGLGWAVDAVPTLKGGSSIGIPSPPAIRLPDGDGIVLPDVRDAERLQGFDADWTLPATTQARRKGVRWKLVGNAVSVPMSTWVGKRLLNPGTFDESESSPLAGSWPDAAWGSGGRTLVVPRSHFPVVCETPALLDFLEYDTTPLSERATAGFLTRAKRGSLRFPNGFIDDVAAHLDRVRERVAA